MKNNKKGFTLIELLAVIVILAIIALIATPIVLNIIDDAKNESDLRSAEFYLKSLELSIAQSTLDGQNIKDGVYNILPSGNICLEAYSEGTCTDNDNNSNNNELVVEVKGKVPSSGTIVIQNGQIVDKLSADESKKTELVINEQKIIMQDGELTYPEVTQTKEKTFDDICTYDGTNGVSAKTAGAKYSCEVKPGTSYTFYVLTTPTSNDTSINLIMDQNIYSDGTPSGTTGVTQTTNPNQYSFVAWNNEGDQAKNTYGPVTAMNFLYNATKDWTNVPALNYEYKDREHQNIESDNTTLGYISFVSNNGVLTITPLSGTATTIGTSDYPLRARMPIYSSDSSKTEITSKTNASYLYDNLSSLGIPPFGYWTLSSNLDLSEQATGTSYSGSVGGHILSNNGIVGVRPVISLKI